VVRHAERNAGESEIGSLLSENKQARFPAP
jgi:hypothetical protein